MNAITAIDTKQLAVLPHAKPARAKRRHFVVLGSFLLLVFAPFIAAGFYLFAVAQDQYASTIAFTVRSEDGGSPSDLLGGLSRSLGSTAAHDSDILYEYIQSQEIVQNIDSHLDLRRIYAVHSARDPLFSYDMSGTIEDLAEYWKRMIRISYDNGSGLMEVRVNAFSPQDAYAIAAAILEESQFVINEISANARADATRYTQEDLNRAEMRLRDARQALTDFRVRNQIVDPSKNIEGQIGLLTNLQSQLATALIDHDLLLANAQGSQSRIKQAQVRINVIKNRINEERDKFSETENGGSYAATISDFERLSVDLEFAQVAFTAARSAHDAALADARRTTRYLATFISPTVAERSLFPERGTLLALVGLFLMLGWSIVVLIYYSLRDRR